MPLPAMPWYVMVMSCRAMSMPMPWHAMCHATPCHAMLHPCHVTPCHAMPCYTHVTSRRAMPCHATTHVARAHLGLPMVHAWSTTALVWSLLPGMGSLPAPIPARSCLAQVASALLGLATTFAARRRVTPASLLLPPMVEEARSEMELQQVRGCAMGCSVWGCGSCGHWNVAAFNLQSAPARIA